MADHLDRRRAGLLDALVGGELGLDELVAEHAVAFLLVEDRLLRRSLFARSLGAAAFPADLRHAGPGQGGDQAHRRQQPRRVGADETEHAQGGGDHDGALVGGCAWLSALRRECESIT
jgi:hypothetical protein